MRFGVYGLAIGAIVMQMAAAQAETFADALASAYRNSNLLAQRQATLRAADEDAAVAVARLRPVVQFITTAASSYSNSIPSSRAGWGGSFSLTPQLQASMTLLDFGRGAKAVEIQKEVVLSTEASLTGVEQTVLLSAAQAYVNVLLQQEMVGMQQSNVRVLTEELRAAKDRFDVGEVTRTDVSQAEAQLAAAKAQLAASEGQLALMREAYKATVGHYPSNLAPLPKAPQLPKSLVEAQSIASRTHPDILAAQHQSRAADLGVEAARLEFMPTVKGTVGASVSRSYSDFGTNIDNSVNHFSTGDNLFAQVQLTQTLYAGGQISANYRKALNNQDAARAGLQQTAVMAAQNVGNAWAQLSVAAASIAAGDQQIAAAQADLDGVKEEAAIGSRTTLDVLNAEQALLGARASRAQALANLYIGEYSLLATMGLMTAEHLRLGVPTYDPAAYYDAVKSAPATSVQGARLDKILKLMGRD